MSKSMKRTQELIDRFDMPSKLCLGVPKITISGRSELLIENHRGILSYGTELIQIDCGGSTVSVRGDGLELEAMDKMDMLIKGRLLVIELE